MIHFVSLISREDKPLYIQSFDAEEHDEAGRRKNANDFLKYNFLSHMAVDVFSLPLSLSLREEQQQSSVLLLFIQDDVAVYGTETNNGLKIVVGYGEEPVLADVAALCQRIHKCYLRTICNPFTELLDKEQVLLSPRFDKGIRDIVCEKNRV